MVREVRRIAASSLVVFSLAALAPAPSRAQFTSDPVSGGGSCHPVTTTEGTAQASSRWQFGTFRLDLWQRFVAAIQAKPAPAREASAKAYQQPVQLPFARKARG